MGLSDVFEFDRSNSLAVQGNSNEFVLAHEVILGRKMMKYDKMPKNQHGQVMTRYGFEDN